MTAFCGVTEAQVGENQALTPDGFTNQTHKIGANVEDGCPCEKDDAPT